MKDRVVLFVSDRGFIVPTLVAARQVLAQASVMQHSDILVALVGFEASEHARLSQAFPTNELRFVPLATEMLAAPPETFQATHVNLTSVARLLTPTLIPPEYEHILYLDGDIQVIGDLTPLVAYDVPQGRLLAANDRLSFSRFKFGELGSFWRDTRQYMRDLGIQDEHEYFNSGVLAARRDTWAELCDKAVTFFEANPALCRFHDQSALNAVCQGRREIMSPRYNFASGMAELVSYKEAKPSIVHFTGAKKPWLFNDASPWGGDFSHAYHDLLAALPFLEEYTRDWPRLRAQRVIQPHRQAATAKAILADVWYRVQNRALLKKNFTRAVQLSNKV